MSRLTQKGQGAPFSLFLQSSDVSLETLAGAKFDTPDGREFVLVRVGASAIQDALLVQSSAVVANHINGALGTAATGATSVSITPTGTAVTANQYRGGFLYVNAGTGIGQTLKIASHPAANSATAFTLQLEDPITNSTSGADSKGTMLANPYLDVIVAPASTLTGAIVGATLYPVDASTTATASYAFIQTSGTIALLSESNVATTPGAAIIGAAATAGFGRSATGTTGFKSVGSAQIAGVSGEARPVFLDL